MTSPYSVNWYKGNSGNAIKGGDILKLKVKGVDYISGGIYQKNIPVLAFFEMKDTVSIRLVKGRTLLGRAKSLPKGTYVLKTRTAGNGWDDEFEIE